MYQQPGTAIFLNTLDNSTSKKHPLRNGVGDQSLLQTNKKVKINHSKHLKHFHIITKTQCCTHTHPSCLWCCQLPWLCLPQHALLLSCRDHHGGRTVWVGHRHLHQPRECICPALQLQTLPPAWNSWISLHTCSKSQTECQKLAWPRTRDGNWTQKFKFGLVWVWLVLQFGFGWVSLPRPKFFLQMRTIWGWKPREIKLQNCNFKHPQFHLLQICSCVSEFCQKFASSVEKLPLPEPPIFLTYAVIVQQLYVFWLTKWFVTWGLLLFRTSSMDVSHSDIRSCLH